MSDSHDFMDIDRKEAHESHADIEPDGDEPMGSVYRFFVSSDDEDDDPDAYICPICEQYADYCECDGEPDELWPLDEEGREI